ncbi:hypothetical protein [Streptacidiphilus albus]|uniref:hypothetical protein n=1 Tax=Streptacidiphilus albus TaxID=105425 RepID=UPI00054C721E|nr:hypothetical protein [Streptacidiphilus albus]
MARTPDVEVYICRHASSGTTAHGCDPLIALLLARAGFWREDFFGTVFHRLPYDLRPGSENAMATDAARMIRAAHYTVHLAPDLDQEADPALRDTAPETCPIHPRQPQSWPED